VGKYDIQDETKDFFTFLSSDEWLTTAEFDNESDFNKKLGAAVDPLSQKVMNAKGEQLVEQMPVQMTDWIRDSSLLWIKNKGAGSPTTEEAQNSKDSKAQLKALRDKYEKKIAEMEKESKKQDAKILKLYNTLQGKTEEHESLVDLMSENHDQEKEELVEKLNERHDQAI